MQRYKMETNAILRDTGLPNTSSSCGAQVDVYARPSEDGAWVRADAALTQVKELEGTILNLSGKNWAESYTKKQDELMKEMNRLVEYVETIERDRYKVIAERDELASLVRSQLGAAVSLSPLVVLAEKMGWSREVEPSLAEWLRVQLFELHGARKRLDDARLAILGAGGGK